MLTKINVDIKKALDIEGWMQETELTWLAEHASTKQLVVEVGSYKGRSARAIGDNVLGSLVAIDTWVGPISLGSRETLPSFETEFRTNLSDLLISQKVNAVKPDDEILLALHPDMVFIDGDHFYQSVVKDIKTWKPRIQSGGLLCGHDFSCKDVTQALTDLGITANCTSGTDIWYINV